MVLEEEKSEEIPSKKAKILNFDFEKALDQAIFKVKYPMIINENIPEEEEFCEKKPKISPEKLSETLSRV